MVKITKTANYGKENQKKLTMVKITKKLLTMVKTTKQLTMVETTKNS